MMSNEKPNVLVIQPDQHRGTVMGCAGDSQVKTPNLDRLASEGIRFSRCASSSPCVLPISRDDADRIVLPYPRRGCE